MKTFTDIASEAETSSLKNSGLSFDPSYFKAKKEVATIMHTNVMFCFKFSLIDENKYIP